MESKIYNILGEFGLWGVFNSEHVEREDPIRCGGRPVYPIRFGIGSSLDLRSRDDPTQKLKGYTGLPPRLIGSSYNTTHLQMGSIVYIGLDYNGNRALK